MKKGIAMIEKRQTLLHYGWLVLTIAVMVSVPLLYIGSWLSSLKYLALIAFFAAYALVRSPFAPAQKIGRPLAAGVWMLGFVLIVFAGVLRQLTGLFEVTAVLLAMAMSLGEVFRPLSK